MTKQKWKFEITIEVDEIWIADGFNPTTNFLENIIENNILGYAHFDEYNVKAKLLNKPKDIVISKLQGYTSLKHFKKDNKEND